MAMPDILTGKNGSAKKDAAVIAGIHITGWDFEPKVGEDRFASDKTSGHKVAFATVVDFDARIRIKVPADGSNLPIGPGSTFSAEFHGDTGGSNYIKAPVVVIGDPIPCDIADGQNSEVEFALAPRGPATFYGLYWWGAGSSGQIT